MSLFNRFRKNSHSTLQQELPGGSSVTAGPDKSSGIDGSLREEVSKLYDWDVDPLHAIRAMLHDRDRKLTTDAKRIAEIWLGVNDLLDRNDIVNPLRSELVSVRDVLAKTIEDSGPGPKSPSEIMSWFGRVF